VDKPEEGSRGRPFAVLKRVFNAGHVLVTTVERVRVKMVFACLCFNLVQLSTLGVGSVAWAIDLPGEEGWRFWGLMWFGVEDGSVGASGGGSRVGLMGFTVYGLAVNPPQRKTKVNRNPL